MNNIKNKNRRKPNRKGNGMQNGRNRSRKKAVSAIDPRSLVKKAVNGSETESTSSQSFSEFQLNKNLLRNIEKKGYTNPTEIQSRSFKALLQGRDMIGVANTGTGKTGAFLIPLIERLTQNPHNPFTTLVVVPTRELAQQVESEFKSLTHGMKLFVSCYIGGTSMGKDLAKARRGSHVVVGTPGRLLDLANRGAIRFQDMSVLVLDEFDRMLDMGFVNDIKKMVSRMKRREQTLLFSATIDPKQRSLINSLVENPLEIKVSRGTSATNMVDQDIITVGPAEDKFGKLLDLIGDDSFEKVILFAETKRLVDRLSKKLSKSGISSGMIHGDKSQNYRTRAIEEFKRGRTRVLVATDVAARGIDIQNVTHVINYQLPMTMDSYIHRIGRTGRAGNKGMAYTFVN
jgi:ATP-dependent RNA helicase RhlE